MHGREECKSGSLNGNGFYFSKVCSDVKKKMKRKKNFPSFSLIYIVNKKGKFVYYHSSFLSFTYISCEKMIVKKFSPWWKTDFFFSHFLANQTSKNMKKQVHFSHFFFYFSQSKFSTYCLYSEKIKENKWEKKKKLFFFIIFSNVFS